MTKPGTAAREGETSGQVLGEGGSRSGSQLWQVNEETWAGLCCPRIALALPQIHCVLGYSLPLPPWTLQQLGEFLTNTAGLLQHFQTVFRGA